MSKGLKIFLSALAAVYAVTAVIWFLPFKTSYTVEGIEYDMTIGREDEGAIICASSEPPRDGLRRVTVSVTGERRGMMDIRDGDLSRSFHGDIAVGDVVLNDVYLFFNDSRDFTWGYVYYFENYTNSPYNFHTSFDRSVGMMINGSNDTCVVWPATNYEEAQAAYKKIPSFRNRGF